MGMDWLKGLVGSQDQMVPAGQPIPSPYGTPQASYGAQQGAWGQPPGAQPTGPMPGSPPPAWGQPMPQPSTQQPQQPVLQQPTPQPPFPAPPGAAEAEIARLRQDVDAIALFARTLLALLESKGVCNEQEFQAMKLKIDAMDGKVDGR